jgi:hypothetical protein
MVISKNINYNSATAFCSLEVRFLALKLTHSVMTVDAERLLQNVVAVLLSGAQTVAPSGEMSNATERGCCIAVSSSDCRAEQ